MKKISFVRIHILALVFGCGAIHAANFEVEQNEPGSNNAIRIEPIRNSDGTFSLIAYPEPKASVVIEARKHASGTIIGNPYISPVSLLLPSKNYNPGNLGVVGGQKNSGNFAGLDINAALSVSGRFESSRKFQYKDVKELWRKEKPQKASNIEYLKIKDWDVMIYDQETGMEINGKPLDRVVLKASLLRAGTWLRLRLSDTADIPKGLVSLRQKNLRYIEAIQVIVGKLLPFQLKHTGEGISIIATSEKSGRLFIKSKTIQLLKYDMPGNPGIFIFEDPEAKIKITARLRPSSDYNYESPAMPWDAMKAALTKDGTPVAGDFNHEKIRDWDVMLYDIKTNNPKRNDVNMRASRVIDGTWFDVQLASSEPGKSASLRNKLRKYMKNIIATGAQAGN